MNKNEEILRESIRQLIRNIKSKRINEEQKVRNSLKKLMRLELKKMLFEGGGLAVMYGSEDVTIFYMKSYILKSEASKSKKGNTLQTKWSLVTKVKI